MYLSISNELISLSIICILGVSYFYYKSKRELTNESIHKRKTSKISLFDICSNSIVAIDMNTLIYPPSLFRLKNVVLIKKDPNLSVSTLLDNKEQLSKQYNVPTNNIVLYTHQDQWKSIARGIQPDIYISGDYQQCHTLAPFFPLIICISTNQKPCNDVIMYRATNRSTTAKEYLNIAVLPDIKDTSTLLITIK